MSDAHGVARDQLRAFIERIERLEEEKKTIADDIKDVYGEAKSMGYDTKIMKQVIALRKKDDQERTEEDLIRDTYLAALGMIPDFEPESDEEAPVATKQPAKALQSPRKAAEAVSERTATQSLANEPCDTVTERSVLVEADKAEAVAGVLGQPETIPALTVQHDGVNVSGPERADVTDRRDDHLNSPIAPASQGEAEAPSAESVSPEIHGSSDANTGGEDVTVVQTAHQSQAGGLVKIPPAKHSALILRPHCQKPGAQDCPGSGRQHCRACAAAMREEEVV